MTPGVNLFRLTDVSYYHAAYIQDLPRWTRIPLLPKLYRRYRRIGVSRRVSWQICWNIFLSCVDKADWFKDAR
jgi:hypothetical protein